jgi:hypothetical protein
MDMNSLITNAISDFKKGIDISNLLDEINANEAELGEWWHVNIWGSNYHPKLHTFVDYHVFFGDHEDIEYNFDEMLMDLGNDQDIVKYINEQFEYRGSDGISYQTLAEVYFNDVYISVFDESNHFELSCRDFSISLSDNASDHLSHDVLIISSDKIESPSESELVAIFKCYMSEYIKYSNMDIDLLIKNVITSFKNGIDVNIPLRIINGRRNEISIWCGNNLFRDNDQIPTDFYRCVTKVEFFEDLHPTEAILNDDQAILKYIKQRIRDVSSSSKSIITIMVCFYQDLYIGIYREIDTPISFNYDVEYSGLSLSLSPDIRELLLRDDIVIKENEVINYAESELVALFRELYQK